MTVNAYDPKHDSGVAWIGNIPSSWSVMPLRHAVSLVTDRATSRSAPVALENIEGWTGNFIDTKSTYLAEGTQFRAGDILFGKLRPYLAKVWLASKSGEAVGDFHVVRPSSRVIGEYIQKVMISREVISQVSGSTYGAKMPRVSWDFLGSIPVPVPPVEVQKDISDYITRETAKIDELISEQDCLISLLLERRHGIIREAVSRGIHVDVQYRGTSSVSRPLVPSHWDFIDLKRVVSIERGRFTHRPRNDPALYDGNHPFIQTGDVADANSDGTISKFRQTLNDRGLSVSRMAPAGTIVMAIAATVAKVAVLGFDACFPDSVVAMRPSSRMHQGYLLWLLRSAERELIGLAVENTQLNLNVERIGALSVPLPPVHEQEEIDRYLGEIVPKVNESALEATRFIALLRERRTALISAAVLGKIDVKVPEPVTRPQVAAA